MDRLETMRILVDVCDRRSFSATARHHGVAASSVTRAITALERRLRVQLLHRNTRSIAPTAAGEAFVSECREILRLTEAAERAVVIDTGTIVGDITISAPVSFGRLYAGEIIAHFMAAHPGIRIELRATNRFEALIEQRLDFAIRIGTLADSTLLTKGLGQVHPIFAASPRYLARAPSIRHLRDLSALDIIAFEGLAGRNTWPARVDGMDSNFSVRPRFWSESAETAIAVAVAGGGVIAALSYQIEEHIQSGRLVAVLADYNPSPVPIQVVLPSSRHIVPAVRGLIDAFASAQSKWSA